MPGAVETYFQHNPYLPIRSHVRAKLRSIIDSNASVEMRRVSLEEASYAFPLFAFNLLKLVNSTKFNLKSSIVVLKQAASLPTFEQLTDLVGAMPEYPDELDAIFSLNHLEEHGRAVGLTVQILASLAKRFSTQERERFYTAALFHDIGQLFLAVTDPDGYARLATKYEEAASMSDAEKVYYGTDHGTVSALALEAIGIQDADLLTAVREHHGVPAGSAVLVAYADRIVSRFGIGPASGTDISVGMESQDEARLRVAVEEVVHLTVGEILMHVLSEIDTALATSQAQQKSLGSALTL